MKNERNEALSLNDYQEKAMTTCMPSSNNFSYMMLNLVGEVGEFAGKVAKGIRKGVAEIQENNDFAWIGDSSSLPAWNESVENNKKRDLALQKEAGDILWQIAGLCAVMGWGLEDIARMNLEKLQARKANGTIDGSGDGITKEDRLK